MDIVETFCVSRERALAVDPGICFVITKSDNANMVVYTYDKERCIESHWQTWEEMVDEKPAIYHLSVLEKSLAFGFSGPKVEKDGYSITLNGYASLPITVLVKEGVYLDTMIDFSGIRYRLLGIHAHMPEGFTTNLRPKGISLIVQMPLGDNEFGPTMSIYLDKKVKT
jgi:hypothetical protein